MTTWQSYPSAATTGINSLPDTYIDGFESVGSPLDAAATSNNSTNSMFALLKGCCAGLGVPAGSGAGITNTSRKVFHDPERALGEKSDAPSTGTGTYSAIALLKGILSSAGL